MAKLLLQPDSVDIRGDPRCVWVVDGELLGKREKIPKWEKLGKYAKIIASVSLLGHQRCEWAVDGSWGIIRKKREERP